METTNILTSRLFCLLFCWWCILSATLAEPWGFGRPALFVSPSTFSRVHRDLGGYPKLRARASGMAFINRLIVERWLMHEARSWLVWMSTWLHNSRAAVPSSIHFKWCVFDLFFLISFSAICSNFSENIHWYGFNFAVCYSSLIPEVTL